MPDSNHIQERHRLEINGTIILAVAALALTWCTYQSALWNGIQMFRLAESNKYMRDAQANNLMVSNRQLVDAMITINFVDAVIGKNDERIRYYLDRGQPGLKKLLTDWLKLKPLQNSNAPVHPMLMDQYNQYIKNQLSASDSAVKKADQMWKEAQQANINSDNYTLLTVTFSLVMFLGAIATKLVNNRLVVTLYIISGIICFLLLLICGFVMPVTSVG